MTTPMIEVRGLQMHFPIKRSLLASVSGRNPGAVRAVDGIDLIIRRGESVGLVGESGCGKSTLGRCITGLLKPTAGELRLAGRVAVTGSRRSAADARIVQVIFQDPYSSLNPRMTVRQAVTEVLRVHHKHSPRKADQRLGELLDLVRLDQQVANAYPRQLSGGQRQRVSIARALAVEPEVLIADEPVSALDVSVQATVVNLLGDLRRDLGLTLVLISHNMAVVRHVCERTMVMYLGRIVETGPTEQIFSDPRHPYTRALIQAVPRLAPGRASTAPALPGDPPSPINLPPGCRFSPRCPIAQQICEQEDPVLASGPGADSHQAACHFAWTATQEYAVTQQSRASETQPGSRSGSATPTPYPPHLED
jgi:oligopeptide transport system ATP-binding protein